MRQPSLLFVCSLIIACASGCDRGQDTPMPPVGASSSRLAELLAPHDPDAYPSARLPREFSFPEDHGPHPDYRNEWWYVTGNLDSSQGRRFGFELTIFRFALAPPEEGKGDSQASAWTSAWATSQVYIGHFAVTDVAAERFYVAERYARGALGLAGATALPFRAWVEDWYLEDTGDGFRLSAVDRDVELSLSLQALKDPVLNGRDGLSQKSQAPGNASYYYSVPRLRTLGSLSIGGDSHDVSGLAWLDREWGSSALSREQAGWDWFALQLSDGSDLMYYNLRKTDGTDDPHSAGTFSPAEGDSEYLSRDDVSIEARRFWDSPQGGRYPMGWTISIPRLDLVLQVDPVLDAQELHTTVRYWEGAVDVAGTRSGLAVGGRGYVELTGYASAPRPK
jgi:predicted secreted hydrolase